MDNVLPLTHMIETPVYLAAGGEAGSIDELIIDPSSGIVRFARIQTTEDTTVIVPWAALLYEKSRRGFRLTERGQRIFDRREVP